MAILWINGVDLCVTPDTFHSSINTPPNSQQRTAQAWAILQRPEVTEQEPTEHTGLFLREEQLRKNISFTIYNYFQIPIQSTTY